MVETVCSEMPFNYTRLQRSVLLCFSVMMKIRLKMPAFSERVFEQLLISQNKAIVIFLIMSSHEGISSAIRSLLNGTL